MSRGDLILDAIVQLNYYYRQVQRIAGDLVLMTNREGDDEIYEDEDSRRISEIKVATKTIQAMLQYAIASELSLDLWTRSAEEQEKRDEGIKTDND